MPPQFPHRDTPDALRRRRRYQNALVSGRKISFQALELLLPSTCRLCDQCVASGRDFCEKCSNSLQSSEPRMRFACPRCGRPGAGNPPTTPAARKSDAATAHQDCSHCHKEKLNFDRCVALWTYDGLVRQAIVASKYGSQSPLADALGRRLGRRVCDQLGGHSHPSQQPLGCTAEQDEASDSEASVSETRESTVPDTGQKPDLVTSVPSHFWRRIQRGMGGSRLLADSVTKTICRIWGTTDYRQTLSATRQIKKQAWLGEQDRPANVRGAFRVRRGIYSRRKVASSLSGKHVLLVDDVMTTGATASEIAGVLKASGAACVTVAVVARACAD